MVVEAVERENPGRGYRRGSTIREDGGRAVIGISPKNSFYTDEETLEEIVEFANREFKHTEFMIPDGPLQHTLSALGKEDIERDARLEGNSLENKLRRAASSVDNDADLHIVRWLNSDNHSSTPILDRELYEEEYRMSLEKFETRYEQGGSFADDLRTSTEAVLKNKMQVVRDADIREGVTYLVKELAYLDAAPRIHDEPVTYVYHKPWEIYENLLDGEYGPASEEQGFQQIKKASGS